MLSRPANAWISVRESIRDLEADLRTFADRRMSRVQFRDETANLIGPHHFDDDARQQYFEFTNELFGDNQSQTFDQARIDAIIAKWRHWKSGLCATSRPRS